MMIRAAEGDAHAFAALIEPLLNPAYRLAAVMLADRHAAEDAVQEASIKAWRKLRQLHGDATSLRPWFLSIVANECRMARRQRWWSVLKVADIATLAAPIAEPADWDNPNVVKPVVAWNASGKSGKALYFTRTRAPAGEGPLFHHIGIYAFTRAALARFVALEPSPLELREKLEQLRALEAGMRIEVARVDAVPLSVDTPADLERARKLLG